MCRHGLEHRAEDPIQSSIIHGGLQGLTPHHGMHSDPEQTMQISKHMFKRFCRDELHMKNDSYIRAELWPAIRKGCNLEARNRAAYHGRSNGILACHAVHIYKNRACFGYVGYCSHST